MIVAVKLDDQPMPLAPKVRLKPAADARHERISHYVVVHPLSQKSPERRLDQIVAFASLSPCARQVLFQ